MVFENMNIYFQDDMLCKLLYIFKLNVSALWEFYWFMQNAENFLQPNYLYYG